MFIIIVISLGYLFVILGLVLEGFTYKARPHRASKPSVSSDFSFSIIINYRNEAHNLPALLLSISQLKFDFNRVEFLFINDDSSDSSLSILEKFITDNNDITVQLLERIPVSKSAKKDGITQALEIAKHEHIICTDADVILPQRWLLAYEKHYQLLPDLHFIAGPVEMIHSNNILSQLQHSEMVALQMTTLGGFAIRQPFMCNGANMSFTKTAFQEVNGYQGNDHISSGDDIFLLEKLVAEDVLKCSYLKSQDAIVKTFPKSSWKEMINQRVRWSQKGKSTKSTLNKLVSFQVLMMNLLFILAPFLWFLDSLNNAQFFTILIIKIVVDVIVIFTGNRFFSNKKWPIYLLPQLVIYPIVVISIALKSLSKPSWKDRQVEL
ncbi:glycosyltransferase [Nonlabens mediterrranea]|uniref:Glycosyltransferase n=1 Tax=Nonlabens mediterrranea TaxID=1419947 RepID=A0ABS0A3U0_9FLAO|nr:glycosyltransferase [Nonlabens mediterrranea]